MKNSRTYFLNSVSELHDFLNIQKPTHPLVSVVNLEDIAVSICEEMNSIVYNFYTVYLKKNFDGKIKYGQQYYDFDDGIMTFFAPKQKFSIEENSSTKVEGWMLVFHPDFMQSYALAKRIKEYGFFSYATNEALHLSDKEEIIISGLMQNLQLEIQAMIDNYTQDVVISHIDLLLNYCNRFYNRQFITRKKASNDLFLKFEDLLLNYFKNKSYNEEGLPTVQYFTEKLVVSPHYLNDMLKSLTGQTTQQHIQNQLLEKAKELLSTTNLTISEIAYQLGFQYSQSFSKVFKNKTNQTPLEFRQSFN
ncbi:helix-turn-helix domain-containing protein [Flavobacterium agrisoli]|uniref:Helix-turn-helix transcriptional regulator n=1 Tax=Flavobacterium agrisoli TaxID=2793066 RepID=A0A934UJ46_9FLAO|nr:helix-turn-helix transcriptional regulator [Flavobacterium agrisoli]MBK0369093.1 helix-turn-helix transcriptional regulator [Flavobacterium agrisoli]